MDPPLDEPEFSRWREEAGRALGAATREAEADALPEGALYLTFEPVRLAV